MDKVTSLDKAMEVVKTGDTIMIGGFTLSGCPVGLLRKLSEMPVNNLTAISEDCGYIRGDVKRKNAAALFENNQISEVKVSFLGPNPFVHKKINDGELKLELIPQGTLAERIRAGGSGLGGVLTPTGVGTVVEEGKQKIEIDGKEYIVEKPLHADVALIKAYKADRMGNAIFKYAARNFNPLMAMAADKVVLEVEEIVEPGEINPEHVQLPGVFVDYVVHCPEEVIL
ncbi:MAG: CoA transferase subunit A [Firmicutes bacterium]|nr:CoA transferase subunit A [Bacillota bacterium]